MTAQDMFEKLGYEKRIKENYYITFYLDKSVIEFDLTDKTIFLANDLYRYGKHISIKEYQAIKKQMEELGWL